MTDEPAAEAWAVYHAADCLYDEPTVRTAVDRLAGEVTATLRDKNPVLLCPMTGGVVLAGHLLPQLDFPLEFDYVHATRYAGSLTGGKLSWKVTPTVALSGRHVLVVDDVLDRGITLAALVEFCRHQGAASVHSLVLIDKRCQRQAPIEADFVGLTAPDRYLFGWGMDYKGYLRNVPGIYAVSDQP
ncbi:MAG: hypoxanthine-guanine phosphoribosyltransferase [Immundisolibacter sp.]|uniref:hypoxanthine-guanine phosphoribosyltransferase n=1 Tax=Immundisolibacter sp. TaxID=1934948 RepID=UPI003565BBEB